MEKKLRMKLEDELRELRDQQHLQQVHHDDRGGSRSRRSSGGGRGGEHAESGTGVLLELRRRLNEQEEKVFWRYGNLSGDLHYVTSFW